MSSTSPLRRILSRVALWLIDRLPGGVAGQSYNTATGCPCSHQRDAKSLPATVQAGQPSHHTSTKTMRTVALCIGHSPRDGGAVILGTKIGEYQYWTKHAPKIREMLATRGINAVICNRADAGGITPSYAAKACNETLADLAVELHFNASDDPASNGTECLHWYHSPKGEQAAACIQRRTVEYLGLRDRGLVAVCPDKTTADIVDRQHGKRTAYQRATEFFRQTTMPAVIWEPAFGASNPAEANLMLSSPETLCLAIARGIEDHFDALDQLPQ